MTLRRAPDEERNRAILVERLVKIADTVNNHVDGPTRIKAAVMIAYLTGRPAPTKEPALTGFLQLQQEFGIQLGDPVSDSE